MLAYLGKFFMPSKQPAHFEVVNLLTGPALALLKTKCSNYVGVMDDLIGRANRVVTYPDGTLLLDGGGTFQFFRNMIIEHQLIASGGIEDSVGFLSLDPFPHKSYALWHTNEYGESLGEDGFRVWFPKIHTMPTSDYNITDLQISVIFKRPASAKNREEFKACLNRCLDSVCKQGVFGEGPILKASPIVVFRGAVAQFRLDASKSGQDTLNWILLSVLNFGHDVLGVTNFIFDHESVVEQIAGPFSKQSIELQLG